MEIAYICLKMRLMTWTFCAHSHFAKNIYDAFAKTMRQKADCSNNSSTALFSKKECCDRKSRAACAQNFAPLQQATMKIMRHNLSYYCLLALHRNGFILRAHPVLGDIAHSTQYHRRGCNTMEEYW